MFYALLLLTLIAAVGMLLQVPRQGFSKNKSPQLGRVCLRYCYTEDDAFCNRTKHRWINKTNI